MNILFIGSSGALSLWPFKTLLSSDHAISAVGVFKPITIDNRIIALENESLALAASPADVPLIDLSLPVSDIIERCSSYAIDVIVMSCYGKRLPSELIELAAKGCYNMHPSLLPRFRGPEPIFWQMKQAVDMGVSWHTVVHHFDAGDIVAQQKVIIGEGADYAEISLQLAECGSELMLQMLSAIEDGSLRQTPQDPGDASYYPYPEKNDFEIYDNCSARQLYNFMRATHAFALPYLYQAGNVLFYLDQALAFGNNITLETAKVQGNRLYIPCNEGVLIASYTDKINSSVNGRLTHRYSSHD